MASRVLTRTERVVAYEQAVKLLRDNALIVGGSSGVLVIAHPDTQDGDALTEKCLRMANVTEREE